MVEAMNGRGASVVAMVRRKVGVVWEKGSCVLRMDYGYREFNRALHTRSQMCSGNCPSPHLGSWNGSGEVENDYGDYCKVRATPSPLPTQTPISCPSIPIIQLGKQKMLFSRCMVISHPTQQHTHYAALSPIMRVGTSFRGTQQPTTASHIYPHIFRSLFDSAPLPLRPYGE